MDVERSAMNSGKRVQTEYSIWRLMKVQKRKGNQVELNWKGKNVKKNLPPKDSANQLASTSYYKCNCSLNNNQLLCVHTKLQLQVNRLQSKSQQ